MEINKKSRISIVSTLLLISALSLLNSCKTFNNDNIITTPIPIFSMFRANMVLQREKKVPVWGKAQPNKTIQVSFSGQEKPSIVDKEGFPARPFRTDTTTD